MGEMSVYYSILNRDGWEMTPPTARIHGSVPSSSVLYIAVSRISGHLYCISGCADTFGEITKLSRERSVVITIESTATAYARFCALAAAEFSPLFPNNNFELRQIVERTIYDHSETYDQFEKTFGRMWQLFEQRRRPATFAPLARYNPPDGSYDVTLLRSTRERDSVSLQAVTVHVTAAAGCSLGGTTDLFTFSTDGRHEGRGDLDHGRR